MLVIGIYSLIIFFSFYGIRFSLGQVIWFMCVSQWTINRIGLRITDSVLASVYQISVGSTFLSPLLLGSISLSPSLCLSLSHSLFLLEIIYSPPKCMLWGWGWPYDLIPWMASCLDLTNQNSLWSTDGGFVSSASLTILNFGTLLELLGGVIL